SAASTAIANFFGTAATSQFTQDFTNKTVAYAGSATDYTFRRFMLHYANLCVVAGGVDLFLIGSEFAGLEKIRGSGWTPAGVGSPPTWDYPFVTALSTLADDVRSVFNAASLTKDLTNFHNLIAYSADWSTWMGVKHDSANPPTGYPNGAQWPHLDQLWSHDNIDLVCFDNYLPLSDWTTGLGGVDALQNWTQPKPSGSWPPSSGAMSGLGLTGSPTLYSTPYLKANIEGGERFNWYYNDSTNGGPGLDPNGTDLRVSLPQGDRLTQSRNAFSANQQILGQKQLRWWWNNPHYALYDTGSGLVPQGSATGWVPQSKSIVFAEYGFPSNDKSTNQPNVFYAPGSTASGTAFWSIWDPAVGTPNATQWFQNPNALVAPYTSLIEVQWPSQASFYQPRQDQNIQLLALQAFYEYWFSDTPSNNETSGAGVPMLLPPFCSVWNWDARPFPTFPRLGAQWGDTGNWPAGNWLNGKGPLLLPPSADPPPSVPMPVGNFPTLPGLSWSVHKRPTFSSRVAQHVSGREVRFAFYAQTLYEFELTIEGLDSTGVLYPGLGANSLQSLMGLYLQCQGQVGTFLYTDPTDNSVIGQAIGTGDGVTTVFTFQRTLGGATEPVSWVMGTPTVYENGTPVSSSAWTLTAPNTLTFTTAPASGVAITSTFTYAYNCRFLDDQEDFEEYMNGLWKVETLKFRSVRA
ncbi:MAG TPA: glycoside hydrolase TIM-barrel-like domain-containing protein, partial [Methylocella sp.]|nr:glycoside hydrolase TIM-barrel-like domain-containing protein [Methylocella sp.]